MATKVVMEALSPTMEEGRLVKWNKSEGDAVAHGDVLAEVETDKAVMELVARGDGVLRKRLIAEGASTPVGTLVGVIAAADENIDALLAQAAAAPPENAPQSAAASAASTPAAPAAVAATTPRAPVTPPVRPAGEGASPIAPPAALPPRGNGARLRSSPLARRLASERGLDLAQMQGSGPGGRIIKRDVETAQASGAAQRSAPRAVEGREFVDVPLTQIRKTIARRLVESIGPIPTFYLTAEFDMERVAEMRSAMAAMGDEYKVSFNDIILKAVATALAQHPECNAHWLGDHIRQFNAVHLGMAVATDDGLIVPVVFDADGKSLREIAGESRELAKRARERKLTPAEYTGSTFSVSNLGMFGIDQFTAIINPPEAGILAIGAIEKKLVAGNADAADAAPTMRRRMRVTMSCDHRVIDGAMGAKFLQTLRRMIENPLMMLY
jgi:pyruvate dehydrogenase E2 component (dihydrolipoyllysine-residue acetyltransferase)